jgi:phenylacetate-CoA ligase
MSELTQRFFETLLRTQYLSPEHTLQYQRRLLERLVRHARVTAPFYRDSGRLDVLFTKDDRIDWERWGEVPVLTRSMAQANSDALYAESMPADCGEIRTGTTSGSTGRPLAFRTSTIQAVANTAVQERGYVWAGLPDKLTVGLFLGTKPGEGQYPMGSLYTTEVRGARREIHQLDVGTTLEQQCDWLARIRPDIVMGYPGVLTLIARNLPAALTGHRFRLAVCVGEVVTPQKRADLEAGFGCPMMEFYTGSEFGIVAVEDRNAGRLLVAEETLLLELDLPSDPALTEDNLAEVIVTPFYNYAMPLIRYAPGDLAEADTAPASDARTLRRLIRIAGRDRDYFVLPSGRHWWPQISRVKLLVDYLSFDQIQFAQIERERIELRFVSHAAEPVKNAEGLMTILRAAVPEPVEFVIRQVPEIARQPSGKYLDYVRMSDGVSQAVGSGGECGC